MIKRPMRAIGCAASVVAGSCLFAMATLPADAPASASAASSEPSSAAAAPAPGDRSRLVELPGGRKIYLECRGTGGPTVILVSGYGNAADTWSLVDPGVTQQPVLPGVARSTRVCAYDRPNTILQPDLPGRSDPVPQPRTAADAVAELHALLAAAQLPRPYVLVGHSYGGLVARLYATNYPRQAAGLVLVDASYELFRELLTPEQWAAFGPLTLTPVPGLEPPAELVDLDASFDEMLRAKAVRPLRPSLPVVVLSHGVPAALPPDADLPPGFPDADTAERASTAAQDELAGIVPYARHVVARRSGHYVQSVQPNLVIDAVRRVMRMVRPVAVRCRARGSSCRASVSLAGGASNKKVVVRLNDTDLRLVSVRPNHRSLRGSYGLFGNRLRQGGSEYVFRLNAAQSTPRGSKLILSFRTAGHERDRRGSEAM